MRKSLKEFASERNAALRAARQWRTVRSESRHPAMRTGVGDTQTLISFSDNDYLGLSTDPRVVESAVEATEAYGAGSSGSRLISGNHPLFEALEEKLAAFKGMEAALVFGSGFLANSGVIPALVGHTDSVFADALAHASMHAGMRQTRAAKHFFRHNDMAHLESLLAKHSQKARHLLVAVEGVYSMDGDIAPLGALHALADQYGAWLLVDDAHAVGVLGNGRGSVHTAGIEGENLLVVGTLSKALGSYGGYVAGDRSTIDFLRNRARSFIFTTGLPAGPIAAALKALEIIESEPERGEMVMAHARRFSEALGLKTAESPIVPLVLGAEEKALDAARALEDSGFKVVAIRPPTVEPGSARLRFSFSATHRKEDIDALIEAIHRIGLYSEATSS